jgi:rubredoxin
MQLYHLFVLLSGACSLVSSFLPQRNARVTIGTFSTIKRSTSLYSTPEEEPVTEETAEEKYKREKLAEIAEKKAAEVFVSRDTGKWECQACGYVYDTSKGNAKKGIAPGTPFEEIETFRCPQCGANKKYFVAETETLSGFKENLKYGFGGNAMTAGAKSNIIFGGLGLGFVLFLSGYLLE